MLMYILFPIFLGVGKRSSAALFALFVGTFVAAFYHYGGMQHWTDLDAFRAFPAFILGMLLHRAKPVLAAIRFAWPLAILATGLLAAGSFLGWDYAVLLSLAYLSAALALAADCAGPAGAIVKRFAPLGQLTYAIYMIHLLLITALVNGVGDKFLALPINQMRVLVILSYGLVGILSLVSFKYVETPARIWIDSLPLFKRR